MAGATARAVWNGDLYPAALLNGVMLRIRADSEINWRRAAILKAYLLKNCENQSNYSILKEVAYIDFQTFIVRVDVLHQFTKRVFIEESHTQTRSIRCQTENVECTVRIKI